MKLDYELLSKAPSCVNAIGERELCLRGLKLQRIENLTLTKDQNDSIDMTNNSLTRLDAIPHLPRLKTLLLSNNHIAKIDKDISKYIPNLHTLILANNALVDMGSLDALVGFEHLQCLSLLDNPICAAKMYRLYIVHRCPSVRLLDFRRVCEEERLEAAAMFSGEKGANLLSSLSATPSSTSAATDIGAVKTFLPGEGLNDDTEPPMRLLGSLSPSETEQLRQALQAASSLEDIAWLENLLKRRIPLPADWTIESLRAPKTTSL
ncbi:hypothetical protein BASA50_010291 [Batrachochytrium salamandrivorans]|uniref:U2 small nuclear ribonucleoprotein A' n=1 Tax=Batrachochytrium salamandrivorans TaxID=1357716 RepID=A0ABQ8EYZ6_9FUNG|nr:hypothetical protein BASA60_008260 [Batrachochytrium salamandrivorans]KAH6589062.1 hypothetical protein BASA50_010291 [Batrachochytrium salamandrivorans]KAH9247800.1 hypothetical protein BASA81_014560 [Batrachochytrium salamandrivorans]KAH9263761.1 hypothetical protein BASA83_012837 [Batrachochytrium salamandrivorans]